MKSSLYVPNPVRHHFLQSQSGTGQTAPRVQQMQSWIYTHDTLPCLTCAAAPKSGCRHSSGSFLKAPRDRRRPKPETAQNWTKSSLPPQSCMVSLKPIFHDLPRRGLSAPAWHCAGGDVGLIWPNAERLLAAAGARLVFPMRSPPSQAKPPKPSRRILAHMAGFKCIPPRSRDSQRHAGPRQTRRVHNPCADRRRPRRKPPRAQVRSG